MKIPFLSRLLASNAARKANANEGMGATILPAAEGNTTLGIPGTEADAEVVRVLRFQRFPLGQNPWKQLNNFKDSLPNFPPGIIHIHELRWMAAAIGVTNIGPAGSPGFERMYKNM